MSVKAQRDHLINQLHAIGVYYEYDIPVEKHSLADLEHISLKRLCEYANIAYHQNKEN